MRSDAIIHIPSLIKIGSDIKKSIGGIHIYTHSKVISQTLFYFFKIMKIGQKQDTKIETA
jgi:hypothetical protein